ncbi:MAG: hypothetical protein J6W08_01470 [Alphaproteobacteria bacterium]|nr:hypothetical protein [Alphaproteobacteria bacterium]MBR0212365.1 hypothetical protein [Alphaproteobacteria bacterium]
MKKFIPFALCLALAACGGTRVIDTENEKEVAAMQDVMELEYRDWTKTAEKMTESMIASGAFKNQDKPVIAIGNIVNDTQQRFDTDILTKKIRTTLLKSGTAQIAVSFKNGQNLQTVLLPGGVESGTRVKTPSGAIIAVNSANAEDETTYNMRSQRDDEEYDKKTFADKGTLVAPNMSLSGKMLQRNLKLDSGWFSSVDTRTEYYLQLTLTDLKTGLSVWEDEQPIIKEGDHAPTW